MKLISFVILVAVVAAVNGHFLERRSEDDPDSVCRNKNCGSSKYSRCEAVLDLWSSLWNWSWKYDYNCHCINGGTKINGHWHEQCFLDPCIKHNVNCGDPSGSFCYATSTDDWGCRCGNGYVKVNSNPKSQCQYMPERDPCQIQNANCGPKEGSICLATGFDTWKCYCKEGYEKNGSNDHSQCVKSKSSQGPCKSKGIECGAGYCVDKDKHSWYCRCDPGAYLRGNKCVSHHANACDHANCGGDKASMCFERGSGKYSCYCKTGYKKNGSRPESQCVAVQDPCDPKPNCGGDKASYCSSVGGKAVCKCLPGYRKNGSKPLSQCVKDDPCDPKPNCGGDKASFCRNEGGQAVCRCLPGYRKNGSKPLSQCVPK
eukprot:Nk52_evm75s151 gene=Nk52_evmTU75s151